MSAPDVGTGCALTFQSGLAAKITGMQIDGQSIAIVDVPNMADSGVPTRLFGRLKGLATLVVELLLDPDENMETVLSAAPETVTITFPIPSGGSTAATWVFTGKATAWAADLPVEDAMTGTLTISAKSVITYTAST